MLLVCKRNRGSTNSWALWPSIAVIFFWSSTIGALTPVGAAAADPALRCHLREGARHCATSDTYSLIRLPTISNVGGQH